MNLFGNTTLQLNSFNPPIVVRDQTEMKNIIDNYNMGFESMIYYYIGEDIQENNFQSITISGESETDDISYSPPNFSWEVKNINDYRILKNYLYYYNGFEWKRQKVSDFDYENLNLLTATVGENLILNKNSNNKLVIGKYNKKDENAIFIIGDGTDENRHNILTVNLDGLHINKELFLEPDGGGSSQLFLHGQRTLNSNDDLNDILDQGFYFYRGGSYLPPTETDPTVGNLPGHAPNRSSSLVAVFSTNAGTIKVQIVHSERNRIYYRVKAGSNEFPEEWTQLVDRSSKNMPTDQECIDAGADILQFIRTSSGINNSGITFNWIAKTAAAPGYWELVGNSPPDADRYFRIVDSPSSLPFGIVPGKECRIGLYCEIDGQQYIDDETISDIGSFVHPIYLRVIEKIQNQSDKNHSYFASNSDTALTIDENCVGIQIDCYLKRGSLFNGPVKFRPFMTVARTNAEITEKTKRIRVRELAKENPEDPNETARTGIYFDADKMFMGIEFNNNKEILHHQRTLTRSDLLSDIKEAGIYTFMGGNRPIDSPTTVTSCIWAIVSPTGKYRSLILINALNRMYHRSWDGMMWTDWYRVIDREDHGETRDVPKNSGVYNAYKRAHQLINLKFDPSGIYDTKYNKIPANSPEYIGIPHSSVKESELFLGFDVSLRTFMTAIHNPYSLMHTECVRKDKDKIFSQTGIISRYNMTYRGNASTQGSFYGTSCSSFALYSLGFKSRWINANFEYLVDKGVLSHVKDNSASGVQLMDICQLRKEDGITPEHCVLITDIYRNERGVPTEIWTSESTTAESNVVNGEIVTSGGKYRIVDGVVQEKMAGGVYVDTDLPYYKTIGCRTVRRTFNGFNTYMKNHRAQLYRYNNIEDNLEYEKSDFVVIDDEAESTYEYNDAICTYAGDYAAFRAGFPVYINYAKERDDSDYTKMYIGKVDEALNVLSLPFDYNPTHSINVTEYCNTPGKYIAYLANETTLSDATHFEIIDTTTTVSGSMSDLTIHFNTASHPVYIEFVSKYGNQWGLYELSDIEIRAGAVEQLNAIEYIDESIGKNNSTYAGHSVSEYYVRVKYQGEYGGVTSEMINVVDPSITLGINLTNGANINPNENNPNTDEDE